MKNQNPLLSTASPFAQNLKAKCSWCILVLLTLALASTTTTLYAQEDLFASINGPDFPFAAKIFEYTLAGAQVNSFGNFSNPRGLAFNSAGDLFVANNFFPNANTVQAAIKEITPGGNRITLGHLPNNSFAGGLAINSSGDVFVMGGAPGGAGTSTIFEFTPGGTRSVFGTIPGLGQGLAFDSAGNLFAADNADQTIFKFTPGGTSSIFAGPSAFTSNSGPTGLAFNSAGNLFVSTESNNLEPDSILEFTPGGMESTFATGLTNPRGLAFDSSDNLYVAEIGVPAPGDILKFTPGGTESTFASGIGTKNNRGPEWLAFGPAINTPDSGSTLVLLTMGLFGLVTWQRCGSHKQSA
jgi:VPDSG-CTERM motif